MKFLWRIKCIMNENNSNEYELIIIIMNQCLLIRKKSDEYKWILMNTNELNANCFKTILITCFIKIQQNSCKIKFWKASSFYISRHSKTFLSSSTGIAEPRLRIQIPYNHEKISTIVKNREVITTQNAIHRKGSSKSTQPFCPDRF